MRHLPCCLYSSSVTIKQSVYIYSTNIVTVVIVLAQAHRHLNMDIMCHDRAIAGCASDNNWLKTKIMSFTMR